MFILPNPPSAQADIPEIADFAELLCLERNNTSSREIVAYLNRIDDNDNNEGCDDDDDENTATLDEAMNEIDRRAKACGTGYPFVLERSGSTLRCDSPITNRATIYMYLLLSTRLNMRDNRVHAGIDGAFLLEELSAHALRNYLGGVRAKTLVMGTSLGGTFSARMEAMCKHTCEGGRFRGIDNARVTAQDDKLDTVAWVPFTDSLPGQLFIFGQCKTGTNWRDQVHQLHPENFIKKWMHEPFLVNPLRAFCISESPDRATWKSTIIDAGIVLDRCRLVDFSDNLDANLFGRIESWVAEARRAITVPSRPAARQGARTGRRRPAGRRRAAPRASTDEDAGGQTD